MIDINHLLYRKEDMRLEYKESFRNDEIAETIASFSTANGGILLVGIKDDGTPVGYICNEDEIHKKIFDIKNGMNDSHPIVSVEFLNHSTTKKIVIITIMEGPRKPYGWKSLYYCRDGSVNKKLGPQDIADINMKSRSSTFDSMKARIYERDATIGDMEENKILDYLNIFNSSKRNKKMPYTNMKNFLDNCNLLSDNGLKNTAMLFFGKNINACFQNSAINFLMYNGNTEDPTKLKYKKLIKGSLSFQINEVIDLIETYTENEIVMVGLRRIEISQYPLKAIREAIINSVAHRDYSTFDSFINVRLFDDRLEIINPGPLVNGITIEEIKRGGLSKRRNPLICSILDNIGFMEQSGQGVRSIISAMKNSGLKEPIIENTNSFFKIEFFGQSIGITDIPVIGIETDLTNSLNDMQKKGLNYIQQSNINEITIKKYMEVIGSSSRITAKNHLEKFKLLGLLKPQKIGNTIIYKKVF